MLCLMHTSLLSDTFGIDNNWCLFCVPKGYPEMWQTRHAYLGLYLCHMPREIESLEVQVSIYVDHTDETHVIESFDYKRNERGRSLSLTLLRYVKVPIFPSDDLRDMESLLLNINVKITNVVIKENLKTNICFT